ncbi:hypothetical protein [Bradyrhizobium sp. B120]|uniref:hypothetical protein n=1 Tax=Bradyrhizobium sp. B120 TaxID=3410088 RepID=UPI003B980DDD
MIGATFKSDGREVIFSSRTKCNLSADRRGRMYAVASRGPGFQAGVFRFQGVRKSATARHFGLAVEIELADAKRALQKSLANYDELAPAITKKNAANRGLDVAAMRAPLC